MTTVVAAYGYISAEDDPRSWQPAGMVTEPLQLLDWMDTTLARAVGDVQ
jgi:hypothetical protein